MAGISTVSRNSSQLARESWTATSSSRPRTGPRCGDLTGRQAPVGRMYGRSAASYWSFAPPARVCRQRRNSEAAPANRQPRPPGCPRVSRAGFKRTVRRARADLSMDKSTAYRNGFRPDREYAGPGDISIQTPATRPAARTSPSRPKRLTVGRSCSKCSRLTEMRRIVLHQPDGRGAEERPFWRPFGTTWRRTTQQRQPVDVLRRRFGRLQHPGELRASRYGSAPSPVRSAWSGNTPARNRAESPSRRQTPAFSASGAASSNTAQFRVGSRSSPPPPPPALRGPGPGDTAGHPRIRGEHLRQEEPAPRRREIGDQIGRVEDRDAHTRSGPLHPVRAGRQVGGGPVDGGGEHQERRDKGEPVGDATAAGQIEQLLGGPWSIQHVEDQGRLRTQGRDPALPRGQGTWSAADEHAQVDVGEVFEVGRADGVESSSVLMAQSSRMPGQFARCAGVLGEEWAQSGRIDIHAETRRLGRSDVTVHRRATPGIRFTSASGTPGALPMKLGQRDPGQAEARAGRRPYCRRHAG